MRHTECTAQIRHQHTTSFDSNSLEHSNLKLNCKTINSFSRSVKVTGQLLRNMPVTGNAVVMISRISLLVLTFATMCLAFQRKAMFPLVTAKHMRFVLRFSPPKDAAEVQPEGKLEKLQVADASLNVLLENMPIAEKYSLLLQSYATNIIDNSNRTTAALDTMDLLFTEMLSKSIAPSEKSSKLLIDASSTFCSSIKLGKSLQLAKAGKFQDATEILPENVSDKQI